MDHDDFVAPAARAVVATLAPDELALFEPISRAYRRDPKKVLAQRDRPGEILGSGIDVAVALLSPVALAVAKAVFDRLTDRAGEAVVSGGGKLWKRLRRKDTSEVAITAEQLDGLHALAVERALELGLPQERAEQVADALRAHLEREG
ncbi:hypothetical protein GCM10022243_26960 [Saccharothrix violaceirubra]|uniref:Uncharacterized protein n=1 Tax=Saccharothrix violaceirubra TaxID=413306 RepID=A0A7W7TA83_9PSEU|nr:hypothetical protein [Saccharothrix violaceirubra]MBB4969381.1 hypothetical protein [Saccharothrix violaceirubra]